MRVLLIGINPDAEQNLAIPILIQCVRQKFRGKPGEIQVEAMYFDCLRSRFSRHFKNSLTSIYLAKPDIVGFSCYCWNMETVLDYCHSLKRLLPEIRIVLGGPQVCYNPDKWMKEHGDIDLVIMREGEKAFPELLACLIDRSENYTTVQGLCYRRGNEIVCNPTGPIADLDSLPSPFTGGAYKIHASDFSMSYETMRGCPYSCAYCMYSKGGHRPRYYSLERIEEDFKLILSSSQAKYIWIVDPIFNLDEQRALKILDIIDRHNRRGVYFGFELRAEIMSKAFIKALRRYKHFMCLIAFGLQTINRESLHNLDRVWDGEKFERNIELVKTCLGDGVYVNIDLIYGIPGDTVEDYKRSINYALSLGCAVAVQPLHMLPGSKLNDLCTRFEIKFLPHTPFSVLANSTFSFDDMIRAEQINVGLNYYQFDNCFKRVIDQILQTIKQRPADFFEALGFYLWDTGRLEYFDNHLLLTPEKISRDFVSFLKATLSKGALVETCASELKAWATTYSEAIQFHYDAIKPEPLLFEEQPARYNVKRRDALRVF